MLLGRRDRRPGRAVGARAAAAAGAGALLLLVAPGDAAGTHRPAVFGGDATASALRLMADRNPQPTPVTDLVHAEAPYATSTLDSSGGASATAAQVFPGAGLLGVPALMCQAGACVPAPAYPLMAAASWPTAPTATAPASPHVLVAGPLSSATGVTTAHAAPDRVDGTTEAGALGVGGVVRAGSATSTSRQEFRGDALVVTATSTLTDVEIGGALRIQALRSVAVSEVDGRHVTRSSATTVVSGATLAGTPVTVDATGVHLGDKGDGGATAAAVNRALTALRSSGLSVRLTTPTRTARDGAAAASTGGLLVTFARALALPTVPGTPVAPGGDYTGSVSLAAAGVTAFAAPGVDVGVPFVVPPAGADRATSSSGPSSPYRLPGSAAALGGGTAAAPGARTPLTAGPAPARPTALGGELLTGTRVRTIALVLLGYPVVVLLSALARRLSSPGRE